MNLIPQSIKVSVSNEKLQINVLFYFCLKSIVKAKLNDQDILDILSVYILSKNNLSLFKKDLFNLSFLKKETKSAKIKCNNLEYIFDYLEDEITLRTFIFALKLYAIKDTLLEKTKLQELSVPSNLENLSPLSLAYDKITVLKPYQTRVNGALLSLIFLKI